MCGVDEAGRGPLAGPVTATAVVLNTGFPIHELRDSKQMDKRSRERVRDLIVAHSRWAVAWASHREIDSINILQASLLAMKRAVAQIAGPFDLVLVDGNRTPDVPFPCEAVVKGDATVPEIMAASILAKTSRDQWMEWYSVRDDRYGFERHKGYPTAEHRRRILAHGPSPIHRTSFKVTCPENASRPGTP